MSGSSDVNLKQNIRKFEYPQCAQEALKKIAELLCGRVPSIKSMDLALDLMAEFVFYEVDRRGNKRTQPLSNLTELKLLTILFEFLNNIPNETSRNTLFLNLFSPITANLRLGLLSKLVSLAVGIPSSAILASASAWMQQLGNTSSASCKLAEALVFDYVHLAPDPKETLLGLPTIAPEFTANFLTAMAENYYVRKEKIFPPQVLLKCVTEWLTTNVGLCMSAQTRPPVLPPGAIAMEATTPFAGLLRWCVLAPIHRQTQEIYSELYLALLNSIADIPGADPPRAINVQHLTALVHPLLLHLEAVRGGEEAGLNEVLPEEVLQLALDRLGQAVQVSISVNAVYGHLDELFSALSRLPGNKLLGIVISKYKEGKGAPAVSIIID
ncbi:integrator complex subunit 15 [Anthonomus grandis grandis]|uniref:integrator complex subunit 15 n=1 Tax=Anthonomus grandis grandis TaxID=2921223 RepID=UPI0021653A78|nr:integrator complex subunit 15 [Anthonomus grandis grandis]